MFAGAFVPRQTPGASACLQRLCGLETASRRATSASETSARSTASTIRTLSSTGLVGGRAISTPEPPPTARAGREIPKKTRVSGSLTRDIKGKS